VVQPGDYPQKIAREMNVDLLTFMDANGIENSYRLMPGTVLIVPADAPPFSEDGIPPVSVRPVTSDTTTNTNQTQTNQAQPTPTIESAGTDNIAPATQVPATQAPAPNNEIPSPVTTENP
jgi:LysM repeat protein